MKKIYLLLLLLVVGVGAYATTYTTAQNGTWMTPTTWSPMGIPVPGDVVTINHTVTMDTSLAYTSGSITVASGGALVQDAFGRDIWVNGPGASFTNNGSVTARYILLSSGSFTNTATINASAIANYIMAANSVSGAFSLDSLYNDGVFNNNGVVNVRTFYNNDVLNNYGTIQGFTTIVDSMYNNGTFLNDAGATLLADSCTNGNTFTNNGYISCYQVTNLGTFTNANYMGFGDMTNFGTFTNQDSLIGGGSVTNMGAMNNNAGARINIAISFLNYDIINNTATFTADGRMEIGDSFYNFNTVSGSSGGSIQCADTSFNSGTMSGSFDFCDLTPPGSSPFIDINTGTVAGTITYCTVNGMDELTNESVQFYPNPTTGIVNLSINEPVVTEVYNLLGALLFSTRDRQINLVDRVNGVYLLRVYSLSGALIHQEKVVKR